MKQYYVETTVRFTGTIEADSQEEAEQLGYYMENLQYECVDAVDAELVFDPEEDEEEEEEDGE